jgi:membrane fusion protein, copper/silver efflux system
MNKILIISAFAISLFVTSCGQGSSKVNNPIEQSKAEKVVYTCEMHPEVISDKPGQCPKCGMELIKKTVPINADTAKTQKVN